MRLPATFKALKYVAQGESFSRARQIVKDRRLAKALQAQVPVSNPASTAAQVAADGLLARKVAADFHDPHLMMQDHMMEMAEAVVQMRAPKNPADAAFWKRAYDGAHKEAYQEWSRNLILADRQKDAPQPMRPARLAPMPEAWEQAMAARMTAQAEQMKPAVLAAVRSRPPYVPGLSYAPSPLARTLPQPRSISLSTLSTPPLSLSRRSSVSSFSSVAINVDTPSDAESIAFWAASDVQPKLVRSGSDPEVGGFRPMYQRQDSAEV